MFTPLALTASMIQSLEAEVERKVEAKGMVAVTVEEIKNPEDPAEKVAEEETRAPLLDREVVEETQETVSIKRTLPAGKFLERLARIIQPSPLSSLRRRDLRAFSQLLQTRLSRIIPSKDQEMEAAPKRQEAEPEGLEEGEAGEGSALAAWRTAWLPAPPRSGCSRSAWQAVAEDVQRNKT